jgi:hypothetical protein
MKSKPFYLSDDHTRSFGGKLSGFESRDEAMKEKKHLKAYLAGEKHYRHGYKTIQLDENNPVEVMDGWSMRQPAYFEVNEKWTPKTQK